MNYKLPGGLFSDVVEIVARHSRTRSKGMGVLYWDSARCILSSANEDTGACLSVLLDREEFCMNFLPPNNAILHYYRNTLEEIDGIPYEPFTNELRRRFPDKGVGRRYLIDELASPSEALRCVKELTGGLVSLSSMGAARSIHFRFADILQDRVELRTETRDALLVVPHRNLKFPRRAKWKPHDCLRYIEDVGIPAPGDD